MTPERPQRNLLEQAGALLSSRSSHLTIATLALAFALFAVIDTTKVRPSDGTVWVLGRPELVILDVPVRPGAPASRLQPGDRILGIANKLIRGPQEAASLLRRQQVDSTVDYFIQRGEEPPYSVPVQLTPFRTVDRTYLFNVLLALVYASIGSLVYVRSRNEEAARLFFSLCLAFTVFFVTSQDRSSYFWGDIVTQNGGALARFLLPAIFLHFFLVFPEKKLLLARHPYLAVLLYVAPAMFFVKFTLDQFFGDQGARIATTDWLILGLYFTFGIVALLHSYFSYVDPIQRQRVRILTVGTLTGVLPFLLFKVGLTGLTNDQRWGVAGLVPLVAIPVSFGYCIARYSVMQVELLLRRSLLYTLMTAAVMLGYLMTVATLGFLVLRLSGPTSQLVSIGATLAVAAALWPLRSRVQGTLNRRFLRDREDLAAAVQEFSRQIPRLIQRDALLEQVGSRLCRLLDLPQLGIYLRSSRTGVTLWPLSAGICPGAADQGRPPPQPLPPRLTQEAVLALLESRGEPFWSEASRPGNDAPAVTREQVELARRLTESAELAAAGIVLLVPLTTHGRLVGVFALPAKPTGELYRLPEIELLALVAGQTALQVENARLYEEEILKQKLEEEMRLARQIQSRLLPTSLPRVRGIDLEAVNVSSRQVSGDYYDVMLLDGGSLALVIGDVSGKGMPASLLASNLQAAVRAQCDTGAGPGTILSRVNRQLHANTDPQHFATLFLAVLEPRNMMLRYSSGGHNPPILLRSDGRTDLLEEGGLPLGAFDFGDYPEGTTHLEQGDLLFLYTDGVTEARNLDDEEFGTERLERLLRAQARAAVADLLASVREEIRTFCGRDEADDDITLLALRVAGALEAGDGDAPRSGEAAAGGADPRSLTATRKPPVP